MIKKLGNKGLLLILALLIIVFAIARYISNKKGENTFKTAIIPKIDSTRMNGMVIFPEAPTSQPGQKSVKPKPLPFIFTRKGKEWYVTQNGIGGRAQLRSAKYMIDQLEQISPDRLASNNPADWKDFAVTDSLGTRVVFLYDKDTALDVIVGRFSYIPQRKQSISYIRVAGQNEVYAIDGFLSLNITENFDGWRDKKIMPDNYESWAKLTFTYPADSGFTLKKDSNKEWVFDGAGFPEIKELDSATAWGAIKNISEQNYGSFINNFDSNSKQPAFTLRIEGKAFGAVVLKAYPTDTLNQYVINSTINPTSFFNGKYNGTFSKIFPNKASFFKKDDNANKPLAAKRKK